MLVEDDANLCYIIRGGLEDMIGGYEIMTADNGETGLRIWKETHPDVIVADIEMPVMDGYEMVRRIRETDDVTPILFTSGRVSPKDVVKGYELGVNNYIKKPFLAEELNAHILALLKLTKGIRSVNEEEILHLGTSFIFEAGHALLKQTGGKEQTLTEREAALLRILCENKNKVVKREAILERLWNTDDDYFASRSLDVFVSRLVSIQFWGTTFQASAGGRSPKNCATKLTIFIGKLSLEAGSHNPFFPFSFLSLVGRSNP